MTTKLHELIEKATPGPWMAAPHPADRTVLIYSDTPHQRLVAELSPTTRLGQMQCDADADIIARCNPETMKAVLEALEKSRDHIGGQQMYGWKEQIAGINQALALLNGESP